MASIRNHTVAVAAAFFVASCSFANDALFPSLSPSDGSGAVSSSSPVEAPAVSSASLSSLKVTTGQPTGTFVGQKVGALRGDLSQLQATLAQQSDQLQQIRTQTVADTERFNGTVAAINTRLQLGTTPGNPVLVRQWNEAQSELDQINSDVLRLNRLSGDVASTSGMAAYLLDSVRAARSLSGAVDEDHRQLRGLEDDTNATTVLIERLLNEISGDLQRQQRYVTYERSDLNTLALAIKNGQFYGAPLTNGRVSSLPATAPVAASALPAGEAPLVVLRFDRTNLSYEEGLYAAVKNALDRRPNAVFDVVAVSTSAGSPGTAALGETAARRNADAVVRSLTQMGLPQDRIRLSAASSPNASSGEVQIFVR